MICYTGPTALVYNAVPLRCSVSSKSPRYLAGVAVRKFESALLMSGSIRLVLVNSLASGNILCIDSITPFEPG
jgi:hypothetical protein